jgi:ketosteroid isomerase-like protein
VLAFVEALNTANLPAALECFADEACLVTPDATAVEGRGEIRAVLAQMTARGVQIGVLASSFLVAGRVAMGSERWAIRHAAAGEEGFEQVSSASLVLHRAGALWKLAIVAPWGWGERARRAPAREPG